MSKWYASVPYYATVATIVETDSEEEAKEKALDEVYPSLCHQCADEIEIGEYMHEIGVTVEQLDEKSQSKNQ